MTRSILAGLASVVAIVVVSGTGCQSTGIGDPCTPEQEYDPSYLGAQLGEVKAESKSYQCQSFLCLVNHFQGRVTCPYGQTSVDNGGSGAVPTPCQTPLREAVTGMVNGQFVDSVNKDAVQPNCTNRTATNSVYCSCRCANVDGNTNDGANYCTCPDGFSCKPLISSISSDSFTGLTGSYCVKNGTDFNGNVNQCDKCSVSNGKGDCGAAQGATN
jgi:hypothetical protein